MTVTKEEALGHARRWAPGTLLATGWIVALGFAAVFADWLPLADPADTRAGPPSSGPSAEHWLGTDQIGRDLLARIIYGSRVSIVVGVSAVIAATLVGGTIGLLAGYIRGRTEAAVLVVADVLLAFPSMLLALAFVASGRSRGLPTVSAAIALTLLGPAVRIVRGLTLPLLGKEYVTSARALGARHRRVIVREILPNVLPSALALAFMAVAAAIVAEGALAYLNLSVAPPTPTWGAMMATGVADTRDSLLPALVPAAAMFLTVFALVALGDRYDARPENWSLL